MLEHVEVGDIYGKVKWRIVLFVCGCPNLNPGMGNRKSSIQSKARMTKLFLARVFLNNAVSENNANCWGKNV